MPGVRLAGGNAKGIRQGGVVITNDAELAVIRQQLDRVEAALDALRREVRPKNERLYQLMAESYVELRGSFRDAIDAYFGLASANGAVRAMRPGSVAVGTAGGALEPAAPSAHRPLE